MAKKVVDSGLTDILTALRTTWNATAYKIALYKSNTTPTTSSVLADFTEADFAGYARQDIVTWGAPSVTAHVGTIQAAANIFTRSTTGTAQDIYGYLVLDNTGTTLKWAEKFASAPRTLTNAGDSLSVTAVHTEQDLST